MSWKTGALCALLAGALHAGPAAAQIWIAPQPAEVVPGGTVSFSVIFNNDPYQYLGIYEIVSGPGNVNNLGQFSVPAGTPPGLVTTLKICNPYYPSQCGAAYVTVVFPSISVSPSRQEVLAGMTRKLNVTVRPISGSQSVRWTLSPSGYGTIDANNVYTAPLNNEALPGPVQITATACSVVYPTLCASTIIDLPKVLITISGTSPFLGAPNNTQTLGANVTSTAGTYSVWWTTPVGRADSIGFNTARYTTPTTALTAATQTYVRATVQGTSIYKNFDLLLVPPINITSPGTWAAAQTNNVTITGTGFGTNPDVSLSDPGIVFTKGAVSNTSINLSVPLHVQHGGRPLTVTVRSTTSGFSPPPASVTVTPTPATLTLSPTSASLREGAQQPFTATCKSPNGGTCLGLTSVSWSATVGSITQAGLYTAPPSVTTTTTGTVTACWSVYLEHCKTSNVTINPLTVTVSPATASVGGCTTQQFNATVTSASVNTVTWSLSPQMGTISSSGLYTAPCPVSTPTTVQVKACSTDNPARCGTSNLTLVGTVSVSLTPSSLDFGGQRAGFATPAKTVTLANTGSAPMAITSIATDGEFTQTNACATSLAAGASCAISVRFSPGAASTGALTGALRVYSGAPGSPHSASLQGSVFGGYHDSATCTGIGGWAWDSANPNSSINVYIYEGSTLLATMPANRYRADLAGTYGNGYHGFDWPIPPAMKNGQTRTITVRFAQDPNATPIAGSPKSITCAPPPTAFQGYHDTATCSALTGWGWDANQPNTPIYLYVFEGTQLLGSVLASGYRQDLLNAGIGDGRHGFGWAVPSSLKDGQSHSLTVRFGSTSTSTPLNDSPKTITCSGGLAPAMASIASIQPAESSSDSIGTITGRAENGSGAVQVYWRERRSSGEWGPWITTISEQPVPAADGTWTLTIPRGRGGNRCNRVEAYVVYAGVKSEIFQFTGGPGCS